MKTINEQSDGRGNFIIFKMEHTNAAAAAGSKQWEHASAAADAASLRKQGETDEGAGNRHAPFHLVEGKFTCTYIWTEVHITLQNIIPLLFLFFSL